MLTVEWCYRSTNLGSSQVTASQCDGWNCVFGAQRVTHGIHAGCWCQSPSFGHRHSPPDGKVYYHVHCCLLRGKLDLRWPAIKFKSQLNIIQFWTCAQRMVVVFAAWRNVDLIRIKKKTWFVVSDLTMPPSIFTVIHLLSRQEQVTEAGLSMERLLFYHQYYVWFMR